MPKEPSRDPRFSYWHTKCTTECSHEIVNMIENEHKRILELETLVESLAAKVSIDQPILIRRHL